MAVQVCSLGGRKDREEDGEEESESADKKVSAMMRRLIRSL